LAQRLAQHLAWHYLDSGALYRVLALAMDKHGIGLDDQKGMEWMAQHLDVQFTSEGEGAPIRVLLEGVDVSDAIRGEDCGKAASIVAALPSVRKILLIQQRAFRKKPGLV